MYDAVTLDIKKKKYAELVAKRKIFKKRVKIAAGVFAVLAVLTYFGLQPFKGPPSYGICRTYAELHVKYPPTMKISEVSEFDAAMRVYYTYIDPYGQNRSDLVECQVKIGPDGLPYMSDIKINRVSEPFSEIEKFNRTIPAILSQNPDLVLPAYDDVLRNVAVSQH